MRNKFNVNWIEVIVFISAVLLSVLLTFGSERLFKIKYTFPLIFSLLFYFFFISKSVSYSKFKLSAIDVLLSFLMAIPFGVNILNSLNHSFTNTLLNFSKFSSAQTITSILTKNEALLKYGTVFFALISFIYLTSLLISKIKVDIIQFVKNLDKIEKTYLLISSSLFTLAIIAIYNITTLFYLPVFNNELVGCDALLQSDTGGLVAGDVFSTITGSGFDIKQPLFGIFSLPFSLVAKCLSYLFFLSPISYQLFVGIFQGICILVIAVLLSRLMKFKAKDKVLYLLIFTLSFPSILFALNLEQYVFPTFWLILFIYNSVETKKIQPYLFVGALGSILTNGFIFLPSLFFYYKSLKQKISISIKSTMILVSVILFSGLMFIFEFPEKIIASEVNASSEVNGMYEKSVKYSHFVTLNFVAPKIDYITQSTPKQSIVPIVGEKTYMGYNIIGIAVFVLAIIGFLLNYKDKFMIISFYWMLFSMLFLMVLGWGSIQNAGMFLCTIMYSWAFISLAFNAVNVLFKNHESIKYSILGLAALFLAVYNIYTLFEILEFAKLNYPTI